MLLARSRPSIFLPALMFTWVSCPICRPSRVSDFRIIGTNPPGTISTTRVQGCCSIAAKGIHNTAGLVAFRFFLGIIEVSRVLRLPLVPVQWLTGRMVSSVGWVLPRSHPATQLLVQGQSPRVPPSAFNPHILMQDAYCVVSAIEHVICGTAKRVIQATRPLLLGLSYGRSVWWIVGRCDHPVHGR